MSECQYLLQGRTFAKYIMRVLRGSLRVWEMRVVTERWEVRVVTEGVGSEGSH